MPGSQTAASQGNGGCDSGDQDNSDSSKSEKTSGAAKTFAEPAGETCLFLQVPGKEIQHEKTKEKARAGEITERDWCLLVLV